MAIRAGEHVTGAVETIRNILVSYKGTVGVPVSLADISKIARVEPITLISSNLSGTKELPDILHGVLNIYAAYYLQAVHILSAELSDVRILKILDKTNPDRDMKTLLTSGYNAFESRTDGENIRTLSLESCKFRLPMLESDKAKGVSFAAEHVFDEDETATTNLGSAINKLDTFEKLGPAIGKVIEVEFNMNPVEGRGQGSKVCIPVVVKLDNMIIPSEVIKSIVSSNKDEITLGSRFKDAISGRIGFIKDFLLCSDLIRTQKKTMIKDPTGYYTQLLKRVNNSRLYSALSGNISLAGCSSVVVMSEEDEQEVQRAIGGKLTNQKTREIVFNNTSAMMIVVVDREWSRVSIYIRDIDGFSQNSFDSFIGSSSKGNDNISDLLKMFQLNSAPTF